LWRLYALGARGVVTKDSATQLLLKGIDAVMSGEYWVGNKRVFNPERYLESLIQSAEEDERQFSLRPRELEIVSSVVASWANGESLRISRLVKIRSNIP
jgi:DNA-binding NarL/FixJ family response regulator